MWTECDTTNTITFEQPLNDHIRICLRLEHLFQQLKNNICKQTSVGSKASMTSILKILEVIDRPDIKSKLTQALRQHATTLGQLEQFPQVDPKRLKEVLTQLDILIKSLHRNRNRIGERLRTNEFLNHIRLHLGNPGGACNYTTPAFMLWLIQSSEQRIKDLKLWASEFEELCRIVQLILSLTRNCTSPQKILGHDGFYHQSMDPALRCEMIRVSIPVKYGVYPEFSVGRHLLSLRFLIPNPHGNGHPSQLHDDIEFELSCCRL